MSKLSLIAILAATGAASAQSLYADPPPPPMPIVDTSGNATPDTAASLYGVSMFAVVPPKPRQYKTHDLVTILVEETVKQSAQQQTKADKNYDANLVVNGLIDPMKLLELQLRAGAITNENLLDLTYDHKFDGKGTYTRNDQFSMKIQAEVIDVKPNGVLVLEARKTIDKNGELQSTVLSGNCRVDDVTSSNTILSSQLAGLTIVSKNEGQVNDAGRKGLITRVVDAIFNF